MGGGKATASCECLSLRTVTYHCLQRLCQRSVNFRGGQSLTRSNGLSAVTEPQIEAQVCLIPVPPVSALQHAVAQLAGRPRGKGTLAARPTWG